MRFNKLATLLILIFSLLIISNVIYASELENNDINTDNNPNIEYQTNTQETDEETNIITVKKDSDLQRGINNIKTSDKKYQIMNLKEGNYTLKNSLDTYQDTTPEKIITINGNNSKIDGENEFIQFAYVKQGFTLILNNLTIVNMNENIGGAIQNYGTLIINNCTFENNTSIFENVFGGGAIYNDGFLNLTDSTFKNNKAHYSGSAIFSLSNSNNNTYLNINNCIFEENTAISKSTIELLNTKTNIYNTTFKNNNAPCGSTISVTHATLNIQNSSLINENVSSIILNNADLIINDSTIEYNNITEHIIENNKNLTVLSSEINNNKAKSIIRNIGEDIFIRNSTISNNILSTSTICNIESESSVKTNMEINDSIFYNNTANDVCGILNNFSNASTIINNSTFRNNTSLNNEGIIKDLNGKTKVINSKFFNNTSEDLFKGEMDNFVNVINNEYVGNNLKSYITLEYDNTNDNVKLNGTIKTDEIYNTSVNLGHLYIYQDENLLSSGNINESSFNISSTYDNNGNLTLKLIYDGENSFRNQLREVYVSSSNGEYLISLNNLTECFVIGDLISYDIMIENRGDKIVRNILLEYLIPEELDFVNSSYCIENNILYIPELMIDDVFIVHINTTPKYFEDLNLEFNIFDVTNNNFTRFEENIIFLNPSISLNSSTAHIGDVINLTANVINYNKSSIDEIKFYFNYREVENLNIVFDNNMIHILNYKLADNLLSKEYNIEIICSDNDLANSFSNKSKIRLSKLDTYSIMDIEIVDNIFNLSAKLFDFNNNIVDNGSVVLKINGRTVKSLKVINGEISLENYIINKKYQNEEYEIMLVYTGNSKYNTHRNSTITSLIKDDVVLNISYEVNNDIIQISADIITSKYNLSENVAFIVFKINGKSISSKIQVLEEKIIFEYAIGNYSCINNITVSFYGNEYYYPNYLTLNVVETRL